MWQHCCCTLHVFILLVPMLMPALPLLLRKTHLSQFCPCTW